MELTTATAHPHNRAVCRHLPLMLSITAALTHDVRLAVRDIRGMPRIEGVSPATTGTASPEKTD